MLPLVRFRQMAARGIFFTLNESVSKCVWFCYLVKQQQVLSTFFEDPPQPPPPMDGDVSATNVTFGAVKKKKAVYVS